MGVAIAGTRGAGFRDPHPQKIGGWAFVYWAADDQRSVGRREVCLTPA
jgi:hypothetical protein